jgi:hypothetical protein
MASALWCDTFANTANAAALSSGRGRGKGLGDPAARKAVPSAIGEANRAAKKGLMRERIAEETRRWTGEAFGSGGGSCKRTSPRGSISMTSGGSGSAGAATEEFVSLWDMVTRCRCA